MSAQFTVSFQDFLGNSPQKLAPEACPTDPGSPFECHSGDPVPAYVTITATTKAPSRRWVRQLGMDDNPGLIEEFFIS